LRRTFVMNKKFFLFGMIALLGASLFFLGCPTDSDGGGNTTDNRSAAEKVKDAFDGKATVSGDVVTLTGPGTVTVDTVTIGAGVTLKVPAGVTLAITGTLSGEAGSSETVASKIVVEGNGTVTGSGLNFFDADGDSLTSPVAAGVYDWNADADGDGTAGWKLQPLKSGTVTAAVTVSGTIGTALTAADVAVSIVNDTFVAIAAEADLASWITNLPDGLTAKAKAAVAAGATAVTITVEGTPTVVSGAALAITIPADKLAGDEAIVVTPNPEAKFSIGYQVAFDTGNSGPTVASIIVAADGTFTLPENPTKEGVAFGGWFTAANGGGTEFTGETEVTANITVHALWLAYSLQETCNTELTNGTLTASGIRISSAHLVTDQNAQTLSLKLAGTFDAAYVYTSADGETAYVNPNSSWENGAWTAGVTPAEGKYGAVNIKGLVTAGWTNVAVKTTSPAHVFYTGASDLVTGTFEVPVATGTNNIKLNVENGEVPFKWRFYTATNWTATEPLGFLLYDDGEGGPANKIVRVEITQYADSTVNAETTAAATAILTLTIDYSEVVFQSLD
jgi:hypothetical protein